MYDSEQIFSMFVGLINEESEKKKPETINSTGQYQALQMLFHEQR